MVEKASVILKSATERQCKGACTIGWDNNTEHAKEYCALGILGCKTKRMTTNGILRNSQDRFLEEVFGISPYKYLKCPVYDADICELVEDQIAQTIVHLNDIHEWTFKEIGQWLEGLGY